MNREIHFVSLLIREIVESKRLNSLVIYLPLGECKASEGRFSERNCQNQEESNRLFPTDFGDLKFYLICLKLIHSSFYF